MLNTKNIFFINKAKIGFSQTCTFPEGGLYVLVRYSRDQKSPKKNNENIEVARIGLGNSSGKGLQQNQNRPIFSKALATQSDTKQSKLSCIYIEIKGDPF